MRRLLLRWLRRRRDERAEALRIARYNAELVSLAAVRWAHRKRSRVLRIVPRGTS